MMPPNNCRDRQADADDDHVDPDAWAGENSGNDEPLDDEEAATIKNASSPSTTGVRGRRIVDA